MSNQELAKELQKPYNRKLEKRKLDSFFTDNIWDADLADIQLINKFNKRIRFLFCVIDIFSKYRWGVSLKDEQGIIITNAFQKVLHGSGRKPKRIWIGKQSEFYKRSLKL